MIFIPKDLFYLYVSACLCMCAGAGRTQKRVLEVPAAGITSSCGPPDEYAGNQTPVLWKSSKHSEPLSHVSSHSSSFWNSTLEDTLCGKPGSVSAAPLNHSHHWARNKGLFLDSVMKVMPFSWGTTNPDKIKLESSKFAGKKVSFVDKQWQMPPSHSCPQEFILSHLTSARSSVGTEAEQIRTTQKENGSCLNCFLQSGLTGISYVYDSRYNN